MNNIHINRMWIGLKFLIITTGILLLIPLGAILFKPLAIIIPILMLAYLIGWQSEVDKWEE